MTPSSMVGVAIILHFTALLLLQKRHTNFYTKGQIGLYMHRVGSMTYKRHSPEDASPLYVEVKPSGLKGAVRGVQ